ncbi:MAG: cation-translocating P-type ATPase [Acidimicrobiia bacterium]
MTTAPLASTPWSVPIQEIVEAARTDAQAGLGSEDASTRLAADGPNQIEEEPPLPWWVRLGRQFADPLVVLLLVAIAISLVAWSSDGGGDVPLEALVIAAIVVLNAAIGFWQEVKAVAAVAALRRLSATHATVVRDGRSRRVDTAELVVGDLVELGEGDAVGADCRLVEAATLQVAEASLTGESEPVAKRWADRLDDDTPLAERTNMVFNGTAIVRGRGLGIVVATAMDTEIGRIATMLDQGEDRRTPLQEQISWLGRQLGIAVVALSAVVVGAVVLSADDRSFDTLVDALLVGVSLAVAAVPEGLPAILSVVLALGVQRMAREQAIVKRLSSVETLGSASVVCTDKTGTLTRSEMTIVLVATPVGTVSITGVGYRPVGHLERDGERVTDPRVVRAVEHVVGAGSLVNDASLHREPDGGWAVQGDPTEAAFLVAAAKLRADVAPPELPRVAEIPFSSERRRMTTVHEDVDRERGARFVLVMKGAPDVVLDRCSHELVDDEAVPLTDARRAEIEAEAERFAERALRTIAVAHRPLDDVPHELGDRHEAGLVHLGVVGILDPPRPEAAAAVREAHDAGIRVIMLTGDHPVTAARIGAELGIADGVRGVSGRELDAMDDDELADTITHESVFARVAPEHKLRIVESLQRSGAIVAMTGDGVNDAPALHRADIGVAMGVNGTEVSKEAADMILADDNFATILRAVREGREIFSDIRKVVRYLLSSNGGEVLVMFVGVLAAGTIGLRSAGAEQAVPLLATQILWINLLTDGALALALGIDPAVERVMDRPPRRLTERVVDREMLAHIALIAAVAALAALAALDLGLDGGVLPQVPGTADVDTARTMAFTTLVLGQICNAFNARSSRVSAFVRPFENRLMWLAVGVTVTLQIAVVHLPFMQEAFETAPLSAAQWATTVVLASSLLWADELWKIRLRRSA